MQSFNLADGSVLSYEKHGSGPALVLVHGAFSDHRTNWHYVLEEFARHFTVFAVARRGRGQTSATVNHTLTDESEDVAALIRSIGQPVFLLGHSYGAHVALGAAAIASDEVRKLVLYEAPWPGILDREKMDDLEAKASGGAWDEFAVTFFHRALEVPLQDLEALKSTPHWPPIREDAPATLHDLRALQRYTFTPAAFSHLGLPVLLQIGSESPREFYITDAMAAVLQDARIQILEGQAHEAMTFDPTQYARLTTRFLLDQDAGREIHVSLLISHEREASQPPRTN